MAEQQKTEKKDDAIPEVQIPRCPKHFGVLFTVKGKEKGVCTECVFESKEELEYLVENYDDVEGLVPDNEALYKSTLHDYEGFDILNAIYRKKLDEADIVVDRAFENVSQSRHKIVKTIKDALFDMYNVITDKFEMLVKAVNSNIKTLDISDQASKEEFKRLKKSLDDQTEYLDNEEKLKEDFNLIVEKATKRFEKLKLFDLAQPKLKFHIGKYGCSYELTGGTGSILKGVTGKQGNYWYAISEEILEGKFVAKIKVNEINSEKTKTQFSHAVGLIRSKAIINDGNYQKESILLQSNGYIADRFTNSGMFKKLFDTPWTKSDEIIIKRDSKNDLYFAINDETNFKKAFGNVTGEYRLVIGLSTQIVGDELELIEISKE